MKGFGKRCKQLAGSILLICLLIVTASAATADNCTGSCTHQAAIGTIHYDTLEAAIAAAGSDSKVTLLTDVVITAPLTISKSLELDLGSKTLTADLSAPEQSAIHFTAGGSLRGGTVAVSTGSALLVCEGIVTIEKDAILESSGTEPVLQVKTSEDKTATVNLSGGISALGTAVSALSENGSCELYILEEAKLVSSEASAITFDCAGKLSIEDGTIQAKKDAVAVSFEAERKTELAISGGKILSEEGEAIVITAGEKAEVPTDFVTGGTFERVPTAYIPAYAKLQENADGTHTVISAYTLTFLANGGAGTAEPVKIPCGSAYVLPDCCFTAPADMDFAGWQIGGTLYASGDTYTPSGDAAVTALWKAHQHTGGNATCLAKAVCQTCGEAYGPLASHALTYFSGSAATCDSTGMNAHSKCSVCGNLFVDGVAISEASLSIPALGHRWETVEGKAATCEEDGLLDHRKCVRCGALLADGKPLTEDALPIPASGHTLETVAAVAATCTEAGSQAHEHCTVCGGLFLKGEPVTADALTTAISSHVLSDWYSDEYYHWKSCVDCEEVFRQNIHHDKDANGICDDCGYAMAEESDTAAENSDFSLLFLTPIIAAVAMAVLLVVKKRKE